MGYLPEDINESFVREPAWIETVLRAVAEEIRSHGKLDIMRGANSGLFAHVERVPQWGALQDLAHISTHNVWLHTTLSYGCEGVGGYLHVAVRGDQPDSYAVWGTEMMPVVCHGREAVEAAIRGFLSSPAFRCAWTNAQKPRGIR